MTVPVIAALSHWVAALSREASDAEDWDRVDYWDGVGFMMMAWACATCYRGDAAEGVE